MENLKNCFECPICSDVYTTESPPRLLSCCGKTICTQCLLDMFESQDQLKCPFCRFPLEKDLDNFPKNLLIEEMLDARVLSLENVDSEFDFKQTKPCACGVSYQKDQFYKCVHCRQFVCHNCMSNHFSTYQETIVSPRIRHKKGNLESTLDNALMVRNSLKADIFCAQNYESKHLPRIASHEKKLEVKHHVDTYLTEARATLKEIEAEMQTLDVKLKCIGELEREIEELKSQDATMEANERAQANTVAALHRVWQRVPDERSVRQTIEINGRTVVDFTKKLLHLDNVVIHNYDEWLKLELNIGNIESNFDEKQFFDSIKSDLLDFEKKTDVVVAVVGRGGAGKTSFVNSFFGLSPQDTEKYINVEVGMSTTHPRAYTYGSNQLENVILWDTPGIFSRNFTLENCNDLIKRIKPDFFIYLYEIQFNEDDRHARELISKHKKPIIFCRTKVDNDFKSAMQKKLKKPYMDISKPEREANYMSVFMDLKHNVYEKERSNNIFLRGINRIFYISTKTAFREQFEWQDFFSNMRRTLPKAQQSILFDSIKTTSLKLLREKRNHIKNEIENSTAMYISHLYLNGSFRDYLKFLRDQIEQFTKRLGVNELLKEMEPRISDSIQLKINEELAKSGNGKFTAKRTDKVEASFKCRLLFKLPAFLARQRMLNLTTNFLKEQLDVVYKHAGTIYSDYITNKIDKNNLQYEF